jgi:hypothetical protein
MMGQKTSTIKHDLPMLVLIVLMANFLAAAFAHMPHRGNEGHKAEAMPFCIRFFAGTIDLLVVV